MPKTFTVKMPQKTAPQPNIPPDEYVVVACPKCGKKTYGIAGQKGKKCPVCRRQYPMPDAGPAPRFKTPAEACRFIQAEEAKRAGRMDFTPVCGGLCPSSMAPVIARTDKVISEARSLDAQFATWARGYFSAIDVNPSSGIPTTVVVAAAIKAGFTRADGLIEKAVASGILVRPKPYSVWFSK